ncbi:UNVERIFIED_CONTAM: hypothetical protein K2H54_046806 [Gekko kuhli]
MLPRQPKLLLLQFSSILVFPQSWEEGRSTSELIRSFLSLTNIIMAKCNGWSCTYLVLTISPHIMSHFCDHSGLAKQHFRCMTQICRRIRMLSSSDNQASKHIPQKFLAEASAPLCLKWLKNLPCQDMPGGQVYSCTFAP